VTDTEHVTEPDVPPVPEYHPRPHPWIHWLGMGLVFLAVVATFVFGNTDNHFANVAAKLLSNQIHSGALTAGILILLMVAWMDKSKVCAIRLTAVMLTETAIYGLIKVITWNGFHILARPSGKAGGFPSGHTAAWCALAYVLSERFPKLAPVFYTIAALVAWSRVEDGAHFDYQVAAGAVLGFGVAIALTPRFPRPVHTRPEKTATS